MEEKMSDVYDVCVVGTGAAGVFAAYSFINTGYSVCLIDKQSRLGGTFANAWINNWIAEPNVSPFKDLYEDLHKPPYQVYGDYAKSWIHKNFSRNNSESGLAFSYNSESFLNILQEKFQKNDKIKIYLNAECTSVLCNNGKINSIKIKINAEEKFIEARFFIDATGDAVLCRYAGFPTVVGAEGKNTYNESLAPDFDAPSMLNMPSLIYELTMNPDEAEDLSSVVVSDNISFDGYVYTDGVTGKIFVNPLTGLGVSGQKGIGDYKEAYSLSVEYRKQHWKKVRDELEKKHNAGEPDNKVWKGWNVGQRKYFLSKNYAPMLGIRESYRVKCKKMLTQSDLTVQISSAAIKTKHFIACGNHDIDIHGYGSEEIIAFNKEKLCPYGVPLECFIPENSDNVFVAGRCAGYSHIAAASFRINKSAAQSGWAVGNAVRLLCDKKMNSVKNIDDCFITELQSEKYTGFFKTVNYLEENVLLEEKCLKKFLCC